MRRSPRFTPSRSRAGGRIAGRPSIDLFAPAGSGSGLRGSQPRPTEEAVVVDPGLAFGTGAHATTRACIELLAGLERGSLLDAGCGSGVVAVAAVRLGFTPVHAVDVDPVAVAVAAETARRNAAPVDVRRLDVLRDVLPQADIVVANIELAVIEQLLGRVTARVAVTSGYLASERPQAPGWIGVDRLELDGWAADVLARADKSL